MNDVYHGLKIDKTWSLFLDRDGVINVRLIDDYVTDWKDFQFIDGVLESLAYFRTIFGRIFIVTNQQGIGKGLFSINQFEVLNAMMVKNLDSYGCRIDAVYLCPHLKSDNCNCRKPKIGNALRAKSEYPEIDFRKSIMVGDSDSDIDFGINAGMFTVKIGKSAIADITVDSLLSFKNKLSI